MPLQEILALPGNVSATANPKSSTGRLDIFTRVICDGAARLRHHTPAGYKGPLYIEISPRTFPILARTGSRLSQMRFRNADTRLTIAEHRALHARDRLVFDENAEVGEGVSLSIDLEGIGRDGLIGFRSKRHTAVVDVDRRGALDVLEFWEPLTTRGVSEIILDPDEFYILVSREAVQVPPDHAAEMVAFDPLVGEFRVHYAGFFDPGFGYAPAGWAGQPGGARSQEPRGAVPARPRPDGCGKLIFEKMAEVPEKLYGADLGSNYQAQSLKLSKHFKSWP